MGLVLLLLYCKNAVCEYHHVVDLEGSDLPNQFDTVVVPTA